MKKRTLFVFARLGVESAYIEIQNPVLCRQKEFVFNWDYSSKQLRIVPNWPLLGSIRRISSRVTASGYIFRSSFRSLADVLCSDECRTISVCQKNDAAMSCFSKVQRARRRRALER